MICELENKLSSREVCEMMEIRHTDLLRKIDSINEDFRESKIAFSKYWTESTYKVPGQIREYREFQITKRGCEFLAHKTTGTKGNLFTDRYMDKFTAMEEIITNPNGIIMQLTEELKNVNLKLEKLESMVNSKGSKRIGNRKHQYEIREPLEVRLAKITEDKVNLILFNSLSKGLLRITNEGHAVNKDVLFSEANKLGITKHDIKIKLELLDKIIYKQVRVNGNILWCPIIRKGA